MSTSNKTDLHSHIIPLSLDSIQVKAVKAV